jgi:hypothetical protein
MNTVWNNATASVIHFRVRKFASVTRAFVFGMSDGAQSSDVSFQWVEWESTFIVCYHLLSAEKWMETRNVVSTAETIVKTISVGTQVIEYVIGARYSCCRSVRGTDVVACTRTYWRFLRSYKGGGRQKYIDYTYNSHTYPIYWSKYFLCDSGPV